MRSSFRCPRGGQFQIRQSGTTGAAPLCRAGSPDPARSEAGKTIETQEGSPTAEGKRIETQEGSPTPAAPPHSVGRGPVPRHAR